MTEPTEEARAELNALIKAGITFTVPEAAVAMLALDKHHGRTPPDPMEAKAENIRCEMGWNLTDYTMNLFVAALKEMFPDG